MYADGFPDADGCRRPQRGWRTSSRTGTVTARGYADGLLDADGGRRAQIVYADGDSDADGSCRRWSSSARTPTAPIFSRRRMIRPSASCAFPVVIEV